MSDSSSLIEGIYVGLKNDLLSGAHLPGERIDIAALLARFPSSKTPLLHALNRLVGEGLIEARPHDGYYIPRMTTDSLRDLYECDLQILNLVLDNATASPNRSEARPDIVFTETDSVIDTERLFLAIASLTSNRQFGRIISGLNDRLRPLRRLKMATAFNRPDELEPFKEAWRLDDLQTIKTLLSEYHERRLRHIPELIALSYTAPVSRTPAGAT